MRKHVHAAIAIAAAGLVALTGCTPAQPASQPKIDPDLALSIGALLPQTGSFAEFGPGAYAGVALALQDINDAGMGISVTSESRDSGDATSDLAVTSTTELIDAGVSVIVGALSDGVSKKVIDQIVSADVLQISPGNASPDFSRYADNDLYWRTAPACTLEGTAMGEQIASDDVQKLAVIYERGYCEPGLPDAIGTAFTREGDGEVVADVPFDKGATNLDAQVAEAVAAKPDAVVVVTGSGATVAVPPLVAAGLTGSALYFVGLPITDHSTDLPAGSIAGSIASQPGLDVSTISDFTDRVAELTPEVTDFSYAAESYDAVILVALAALAADDVSSEAIAGKLQEVSGGSGKGTKATDFASAAELILAGEVVDYDGPSGTIAFDDNGDPLGAIIGLYQYGADNVFTRLE